MFFVLFLRKLQKVNHYNKGLKQERRKHRIDHLKRHKRNLHYESEKESLHESCASGQEGDETWLESKNEIDRTTHESDKLGDLYNWPKACDWIYDEYRENLAKKPR